MARLRPSPSTLRLGCAAPSVLWKTSVFLIPWCSDRVIACSNRWHFGLACLSSSHWDNHIYLRVRNAAAVFLHAYLLTIHSSQSRDHVYVSLISSPVPSSQQIRRLSDWLLILSTLSSSLTIATVLLYLVATDMLAFPSNSSRNENDSDLTIAIPQIRRQLL